MTFRSMILGAAVVASSSALMACGGRTPTPDAGCVGIACGIGGGTGFGGGTATGGGGGATGGGGGGTTGGGGGTTGGGGGTTGGGGGSTGGGGGSTGIPETIQAAKGSTFPAEVNLKGVVVTAISFAGRSASTGADCAGTTSKGVNASFWVADPNSPQTGVWVEKFRCDREVDYFPQVGDVLDIKGMMGFESGFEDRVGFRVMVKSEFDYISNRPSGYTCELTSTPACRPLEITKTSTMSPLPVVDVANTFGGGGAIKAEPTYAGARIKIAGPLTLSNPSPAALKRVSLLANDDRYYGYELSNGVLVNNFRTFAGVNLEDGGVSNCDVRAMVLDGGTVTFPNGIVGVWDSYTHAACADGGTASNCFKNRGTVPGTPDANYTNVLYPTDCADHLP